MTASADREVTLPAVWASGIFRRVFELPANAGLVVSFALCRGLFDWESPGKPPTVVSGFLGSNSIGLMSLGAFSEDNNRFVKLLQSLSPHFL